MVNRMEQGLHQYFVDFLQEFEYRMALSGGEAAYTPLGKTQLLKASINGRLRRALVGVKLPPPADYAGRFGEALDSYFVACPGATAATTRNDA